MQSDTIKLLASYGTAVVIGVGGMLLLVFIALQPTIEDKAGLMTLLGGFIGSATTFLFVGNASAAARAQTRNDLLTPAPENNA